MSLSLDRSQWRRVHLGDVVRRSRQQVDPLEQGIQRYVAGGHIDSQSMTITRWGDPNDGQMGSTFRYTFRAGQILFVSARPNLKKSGVVDFEGVVADKTYVLDAATERGLLQGFLPFVLASEPFVAYATREATGSMNPRLLWGPFQRYAFDLPPLDQQRRLADLLWSLARHSSSRASQIVHAKSLLRALVVSDAWEVTRNWPLRELGSVLKEDLEVTSVEEGSTYPMVGVLNRGRGLFHRAPMRAADTAYTSLHRIHANQVIYSKLKAFEGAITVVPEEADGRFASPEFPTFTVSKELEVDYFELFTELPEFWGLLSQASTGMGGRRERVKPSDFMTIKIPVPPVPVQRTVATRAALVRNAIQRLNAELSATHELRESVLADIFGGN